MSRSGVRRGGPKTKLSRGDRQPAEEQENHQLDDIA